MLSCRRTNRTLILTLVSLSTYVYIAPNIVSRILQGGENKAQFLVALVLRLVSLFPQVQNAYGTQRLVSECIIVALLHESLEPKMVKTRLLSFRSPQT